MGAEIRHKLKVHVVFECDFEWDAVTGLEAAEEFKRCWLDGSVDVGDLELGEVVSAEVVHAEPA